MPRAFWTHPSVTSFAKGEDPVEAVLERARTVVLEALEAGWKGPPFDPFELARLQKLRVTPREDVNEARLVSAGGSKLEIEYNPTKPKPRVRYSIAHEVAHTLFPDWADEVRYRKGPPADRNDAWQLELLCNLAAAEFLMPIGSFEDFDPKKLGIDRVLEWRKRYEVSTEAMLLRVLRLAPHGLIAFASSCRAGKGYSLDYALRAEGSISVLYGVAVKSSSPVNHCTAIGYTAKGEDTWPGVGTVSLECAGVAPYPGQPMPRVLGFARPLSDSGDANRSLREVIGDATSPRADGERILAHVVNDAALSWGAGFGRVVAEKYPDAARRFREAMTRKRMKLGEVFSTTVQPGLTVMQMVAQRGYGESASPRLRYVALQECLRATAAKAGELGASVHMPAIGTGFGGGTWGLIREIIETELTNRGVDVTVYRLQTNTPLPSQQALLFE